MYRLYVIPGSHACRAAMLMLEHKELPYERVEVVTLLHPLRARLAGFTARGETRSTGGRRTLALRIGDQLGTVPGLAAGKERISTNYAIARFLDERHPNPPLFPAEPERRAAVETAERWANETLQMTARRVLGPPAVSDPGAFSRSASDGRLGYLLYKREPVRRLIAPRILRHVFDAGTGRGSDPLAELPPMLDRIDAWIADGVLGGTQPNAADFMVAPSLALILYRPDAAPLFEGRPALELVDRLLPDPAAAAG